MLGAEIPYDKVSFTLFTQNNSLRIVALNSLSEQWGGGVKIQYSGN